MTSNENLQEALLRQRALVNQQRQRIQRLNKLIDNAKQLMDERQRAEFEARIKEVLANG